MCVANDKFGKRFKRSDHRCHGPRWNPPIRPLLNRPTIAPVRLSLGQVGQASLTAIETNPTQRLRAERRSRLVTVHLKLNSIVMSLTLLDQENI